MSEAIPNVTDSTNATNATTVITPEGQALAYSALYIMALTSIYFGSFRSVAFVNKHIKEKKKIENSIGFDDAKWFPITASSVLFGLYVLFKLDQVRHWATLAVQKASPFIPDHVTLKLVTFIGNSTSNSSSAANRSSYISELITNTTGYQPPTLTKEHLSYFLLVFFCYEGVFAMAHLVKPIVSFIIKFISRNRVSFFKNRYYQLVFLRSEKEIPEEGVTGAAAAKRKRTQSEKSSEGDDGKSGDEGHGDDADALIDWRWDKDDVFSVLACAIFGILHVAKRNWITNNAFGLAFSLYGIEALHLSSFKGGAMLLAGLFVYDIFWVFATDVMSTVATSVNAPILLMFPQDILVNGAKANKFAMLGLGDIVIPGVFLALLLRYGEKTKSRAHFYITMMAYGAGLLITIGVMHYFKAAQPALLYLVPMCLGTPCLVSLFRGDLSAMVKYSEEHLVEKPDDDKKKANNDKKQNGDKKKAAGQKSQGKKEKEPKKTK